MYRLSAQKFVQRHVEYLNRQVTVHAKRDEFFDKAVKTRVLVDQRPIEPGYFVVLTEAVIVPALGAAHLVSLQQHRHAGCQQRHSRKFLTWRLRSRSTSGSAVGPSTPQFQLRFWSAPSRFPSPFASLCLPL